jgi:hypothetical protein
MRAGILAKLEACGDGCVTRESKGTRGRSRWDSGSQGISVRVRRHEFRRQMAG